MKKLLKMIPKSGGAFIPCILVGCVMVYVLSLRIHASATGTTLGESAGSTVGRLTGSFEALLDYREAYAEGKEEGLSAEDTTAEVVNKIKEVEKLEVLVASVKLHDMHTVGDDYAALYLLKGDAIFTVDFQQANFNAEGGKLYVELPEPNMDLKIDPSRIEKVADWQKRFFSGSAENGFEAYLNSMKKIVEESKESLSNYDALMEAAKASAEKQITELANSVGIVKVDVVVSFMGAEADE